MTSSVPEAGDGQKPPGRRRGKQPGVYKTSDGQWMTRARDVKGVQRQFTRSTYREVVAWKHAMDASRRRGDAPDPDAGRITLAAFLADDYLPGYGRSHLVSVTRASYERAFRCHIEPHLGHLPLRAITPRIVDDWRRELEDRGTGVATIKRAWAILSGILTYAVSREEIPANPMREVKGLPAAPQAEVRPLPPVVIETIRASLPQYDAVLVSLLANGLRPAEAVNAEWEHLSARGTLEVPPRKVRRGRRARQVHLLAPYLSDLREYQFARGRPEDGLIFPRPGGAAWTVHDWRNWHRRVYRDAATDAGVTDDLRAYRLRASCASLLLWEGRSLTYVAKQLGHGVDVLARHYAGVIEELEHADRGELRSAAEAIKAARAEVASRPLVRDLFASGPGGEA